MSFTAEHRFWQRRVEKEAQARNKFIENVFLKSQYGPGSGQQSSGKWANLINGGDEGNVYDNANVYNNMSAKTFSAIKPSYALGRRSGAVSEMRCSSNKSPLPGTKKDESFYLYEVGKSDPNKILPREFKQHISNFPSEEMAKSTFERLAELTSQHKDAMATLVVKKPSMKRRNDYVGYHALSKTNNDVREETRNCVSQASRRGSLIPINPQQQNALSRASNRQHQTLQQSPYVQEVPAKKQIPIKDSKEYTYDGKRKRKRFNEDLKEETQSIIASSKRSTVGNLTEANLNTIEKVDNTASTKEKMSFASRSSRTTAILRAIIKKATAKKEDGERSETPTEYKERVIGLVNQLDERQLEKLDKVLEEENLESDEEVQDVVEELHDSKPEKVVPKTIEANIVKADESVSQQQQQLPAVQSNQAANNTDGRSVHSSQWSRRISNLSAVTMINRLEKQLNDERSEREKMREEIEELKKMNQQLCSVIMSSEPDKPLKQATAAAVPSGGNGLLGSKSLNKGVTKKQN